MDRWRALFNTPGRRQQSAFHQALTECAESVQRGTGATIAVVQRGSSGNYLDVATAQITASDRGSGVASVEYQLDGGTWTSYTAPVVVTAAGMHMLHYRATDVAGNPELRLDRKRAPARTLDVGDRLRRCLLVGAVVYGDERAVLRQAHRDGATDTS